MFTAPSTCPARFALSSSPDRIQAGIGTLLVDHHNPVGTGFYADAQKWLRASAAQGNDKDEVLLGLFDMRDALLGNAEARRAEARAQRGDLAAEALLARAYYQGAGVPRNDSLAFGWAKCGRKVGQLRWAVLAWPDVLEWPRCAATRDSWNRPLAEMIPIF